MSRKSSDQCPVSDDDSEFNYSPGNYFVIESEIVEAFDSEYGADDNHEPYSCEPIVDEYWITECRQRKWKRTKSGSLNDRLAGRENLNNW